MENNHIPIYTGQPETAFLQAVEAWVSYMITRDPEALRQALYRIDVSESDAGWAALGNAPAKEIARLIVARQIAKARSRKQSPPTADDPELRWP